MNTHSASGTARIFHINDHLNQLILENLDPAAWQAKPPGQVRTIAAIFTHMHNIRVKWIRLSAPHLNLPAQLHRSRCTIAQARTAFRHSAKGCADLLAGTLDAAPATIPTFRRDVWARNWPPSLDMLAYMLMHEAHHRGQICLLAHQLNYPLPSRIANNLWNWEKLWHTLGSPKSSSPS